MMTIWKTKLGRLNAVVFIMIHTTILLLIFRYFLISVVCIIILVILCPFWCHFLFEELVISFLKDHNGHCKYDKLIEKYSKKIIPTISRLKKRAIVEVKDNVITLVDKNCVCAFDKFKKKRKFEERD